MSNRLAVVLGGIVVAAMVAACVVATLKIDLAPKPEKGKRPVRAQTLGEDIRVSQHGLYGVDLVSIGRAHMRKLRKGPFTIGAINELVLEDVSLALPEELWREEAKEVKGGQGNGSDSAVQPSTSGLQPDRGPRSMLAKLGVNAGNLKMGGKMPRFSALAVRRLKVSRIDGTNAVPWFVASGGEAERGGLRMRDVWSFENGRTNGWGEALLVVDPALRLVPTKW